MSESGCEVRTAMNISLFGLGYVGAVTATCLAELGHRVVGVEVSRGKVDMINEGKAPVVEPELQDRIWAVVSDGSLRATQDAETAIISSDISLVCVGTPSDSIGAVSLEAVENVIAQIGFTLRSKNSPHAVVVRSTVPPGTTQERLAPALQAASGRCIGADLELCCNPEFLPFRGGTAKTVSELLEEIDAANDIEGISLLGGEPTAQAEGVARLAAEVQRWQAAA